MAWKNYTQDKLRVMERVAVLIKKSHDQVGFDAIREVDWTFRSKVNKERVVRKLAMLYVRRENLAAFNLWKQRAFEIVTSTTN